MREGGTGGVTHPARAQRFRKKRQHLFEPSGPSNVFPVSCCRMHIISPRQGSSTNSPKSMPIHPCSQLLIDGT